MSHSGPKGLQTGITQCFVCERSIVGDHWFAQVKHGNCTIRLCCLQCSKRFYTQKLPALPPSGIASGAPLPCVAALIRCAFQSALIINSVFREFFEVRLAEASGSINAFFKIAEGLLA